MNVTATLRNYMEVTVSATSSTGGKTSTKDPFKRTAAYANGAGSNIALQVNEYYAENRTLAAGANETLDIAGGVANLTKVKEFQIHLPDGTNQASSISVGGASSNPWFPFLADSSDKLKVLKGGSITIGVPVVAGMAVTAGSADKLKVENNDGSNNATYQVVLLGNS